MGINICIMNEKDKAYPDWDSYRSSSSSDRMFPDLTAELEIVTAPSDCTYFRPKDINQLIENIDKSDFKDKERYLLLCKILTENPDYWIWFCT